MSQTFTYLIGQPGAGKSALVKRALMGIPREGSRVILPHLLLPSLDLTVMGMVREGSGGTDALHNGIMPDARAFLEANALDHVFAEGDRLAVSGFWRHAADLGYDVRILLLDTPDAIAKDRRNERAKRDHRQAQSARWVRGRITKTAKLADDWDALRLPGERSLDDLAPLFRAAVPFGEGPWPTS